MNIDTIDHLGLVIWLGIFAILGYKCFKYWQQLNNALREENSELSLYSQKEINEGANKDLKLGSKMILSNNAKATQILFSLKSDNPKISIPLKRIRRAILLFCITPFIFAIVLTFVTALAS
jgi:hypothetical protein